MSKFPFYGDKLLERGNQAIGFNRRYKITAAIICSAAFGAFLLVSGQAFFYAQAYEDGNRSGLVSKDFKIKENGVLVFERKDVLNCSQKEAVVETKEIFKKQDSEFEKELYAMVGDHPIKEMVPYIVKKDRKVAGFLVGIAKKESNWGKRVPTLNGQDCFNYWGYKGAGEKGSAMGYACFASPEEAIDEVGGRLEKLVEKKLDTPGKMVVWKCGSSCAGHDPQGVSKWISDVSLYFDRISNKKA